ncbi:unnamed protein product, partial [Ectocarpus sp. 12 AP-2014]
INSRNGVVWRTVPSISSTVRSGGTTDVLAPVIMRLVGGLKAGRCGNPREKQFLRLQGSQVPPTQAVSTTAKKQRLAVAATEPLPHPASYVIFIAFVVLAR